jgi:ethanolamine transporter EutH
MLATLACYVLARSLHVQVNGGSQSFNAVSVMRNLVSIFAANTLLPHPVWL